MSRKSSGWGWLVALWLAGPLAASTAAGRHGAVATASPIASAAALAAMQEGGNAVDGAVAAALTLGVVDGHHSGLGGGCFLLIRRANGSLVAIDGRETAPAAATESLFVRDGKADPEWSRTGALAVGVPGALAAYDYVLRHFGRRPLREHLSAAARIAEAGFVVDARFAERLQETALNLARFDATRAIFLRPDGAPWAVGERLCQPDLGRSYRAIAAHGPSWFYRGPFARSTERWMRDHGGVLTARDFARYRIRVREPVRTTYRGYEVVGFPPPSSGGVHVAQILNMIEGFDLEALGAGSADFLHLTAEAMKLAFADRAYWLGDPDFTHVPPGLVAKSYAQRLAGQIRLETATPVAGHGMPEAAADLRTSGQTTHFSTADAAGNWVACTATINTYFGSKVVIPGTGIVLNNELDDFSAQPGATNYFGLVGASANAVASGKRPLSSMSPTLVLKDRQPILAVGASGGPTIISQTLLALINTLDFKLDLGAVLGEPRFHHQWRPDELRVEPGVTDPVRRELERRGHRVVETRALAATQAVARPPGSAELVGAGDPRSGGHAAAW